MIILESNPDFEVVRYSDSRYENLTAEIRYKGEPVAQVNQDMGVDSLELEVFADLKDSILRVPLDGFLESLKLAKELLVQ
ncbi:hypothetical protein M8R19_30910 [Pseudomonas sp. R3.Fl]|uniref:hypothetical protein n=1 Tax=Pseudomonas TaxID=286 RepID=UPI000944C99E|nr:MULTISPECIES: hypothetical protein [Pseudomonas]MCL6693095.1 hypothetical protein [Pseudomonas sp. R3.Fl]MCP1645305.1 hypothetical protein [Pseudomonas citronellolis]MCP1668056.1 hypothetical protein [Pseudomonas citronellolis]MCP1699470.1 hypothetical protein [Pseudomonas citronellolis]MCP1706001.1 hypothetical protein [Pseudomonas citronellolis]